MGPLAGMLFTLILVGMVGGFIILLPITRRLGAILERRLNDKPDNTSAEQIRQLQAAVLSLRADLEQLSEQQQFTEAMLAERRPRRLPGEDGIS